VPLGRGHDKDLTFRSVKHRRKAMSKRQRKNAEYWKRTIEDFLKSQKSQKEYTQENNISRVALWTWSKQLGIPLSQRKRSSKTETKPVLSFIDVQPVGRAERSSFLKIEIIFPQGHTLKIETEGRWEEVGTFIKAVLG
jgi:hypothetical protein